MDFTAINNQGVHSATPAKQRKQQKCVICDGLAKGTYFNACVCLPCKSFYIRCTKSQEREFPCSCGGGTVGEPLPSNRLRCQSCRYSRCQEVQMTRKVKPESVLPLEGQELCRVCGDLANGIHFGTHTCEGCKKFFRRSLKEYDSYSCKRGGACSINPRNRIECRWCRYQRCISVGMAVDAIKMGRPKHDNFSAQDTNESMMNVSLVENGSVSAFQEPNVLNNQQTKAEDMMEICDKSIVADSNITEAGIWHVERNNQLEAETRASLGADIMVSLPSSQETQACHQSIRHTFLQSTGAGPPENSQNGTAYSSVEHQRMQTEPFPTNHDDLPVLSAGDVSVVMDIVDNHVTCGDATHEEVSSVTHGIEQHATFHTERDPARYEPSNVKGPFHVYDGLNTQLQDTDKTASDKQAIYTDLDTIAAINRQFSALYPFKDTHEDDILNSDSEQAEASSMSERDGVKLPNTGLEQYSSYKDISGIYFDERYWRQDIPMMLNTLDNGVVGIVETATAAYETLITNLESESQPDRNIPVNMVKPWPKLGAEAFHWKFVQERIIRNTSACTTYLESLPGTSNLLMSDKICLMQIVVTNLPLLVACTEFYQPAQHTFKHFFNWPLKENQPMFHIRESFLRHAVRIQAASIQPVERALMTACLGLASDWHSIEDKGKVENERNIYIAALQRYLSDTGVPVLPRIKQLFQLLLKIRHLGLWHKLIMERMKLDSTNTDIVVDAVQSQTFNN